MGKKSGSGHGGVHGGGGGASSKKAEKRMEREQMAKNASLNLFSLFYGAQYSPERWPSLLESLRRPGRYCALIMAWVDQNFARNLIGVTEGTSIPYLPSHFKNVFVKTETSLSGASCDSNTSILAEIDTIKSSVSTVGGFEEDILESVDFAPEDEATASGVDTRTSKISKGGKKGGKASDVIDPRKWPAPGASSSLDPNGLCCYYPLDAASLLPVACLNLVPGVKVLDMCAAPGGKTLAILQSLVSSGTLFSCDVSFDRRNRLKNVLRRYVPAHMHDRVSVIGGDGTTGQLIEEFGDSSFDRILVDAPCSSERHVLHDDAELMRWAPGRSKANAERQMALLLTAIRLCRLGGRVVYSTCSLSHTENDGVIMKALRRANKHLKMRWLAGNDDSIPREVARVGRIDPATMPFGEATAHGWHILPDRSESWGPIYLSVIDLEEMSEEEANRYVNSLSGGGHEKKKKKGARELSDDELEEGAEDIELS